VLVNQLHAVRGQLKFDGWSIRIHSYEAYKPGKKRELNFTGTLKEINSMLVLKKKNQCSSNRSSKDPKL